MPIKDIAALRQAITRLKDQGVNCDLLENARPRMYYPQQEVQCDFVLKLNDGKYDVGFQKQKDGSYAPIFDEWAGHVGRHLTVEACPMPGTPEERSMRQIGLFSREYARCAAVNSAAQSGYYVETESVDEKGEYALVFSNGS